MERTVVVKGVSLTKTDLEKAMQELNTPKVEQYPNLTAGLEPGDLIRGTVNGVRRTLVVVGGNLEKRENAMRGGSHGNAYGTPEGRLRRGVILATDGSNVYEVPLQSITYAGTRPCTPATKKAQRILQEGRKPSISITPIGTSSITPIWDFVDDNE